MKNERFQKAIIISHVYAPGPPHELEDYLKSRCHELLFIAHPLSFVKNRGSETRRHIDGQLVESRIEKARNLPDLISYATDFMSNILTIGKEKPADIIIALDNLNAASAIWLRTFGKTKQVVFYTIDYIPKRFQNKWLNKLYHLLDNYCVIHADYVWNLSPVMAEMRMKKGINKSYLQKQLVVPIGTHGLPASQIKKDPNLVIFMGHLRSGQGTDLLLDAMPLVLKKRPKTKLRLIGGGELEQEIKNKINKNGLEKSIELTGFVPTNEAMRKSLMEGIIAVAPYVDDETTFTRYTDPGKPKEYLAAKLPVIITRVPKFADVIAEEKAGLAIRYDKTELAEAIIQLLDSPDLAKYQENAFTLSKKYRWDKIFDDALDEMSTHELSKINND